MSVTLPRLDRSAVRHILESTMSADVAVVADAMPLTPPSVTFSETGGQRLQDLGPLRASLRALADEHGWPAAPQRTAEFEGRAARLLHAALPISPHEASQEEVWSYVTCCWLLDIAVWRFGHEADERRFVGNVNRNTFRRMWWRAEILGPDVDLTLLGEDELVNIMERPTIASDQRLARAVAMEFLSRVDSGVAGDRMHLMRDGMKRLLRLTPFVSFPALADPDLRLLVADVFDAAAAGLAGESLALPQRADSRDLEPVPDLQMIERLSVVSDSDDPSARTHDRDFDTVAQVAVDIARRAGRVTNMSLREVAAITSDEAREVFKSLLDEGVLVRRGVKRGTHYVLAEDGPSDQEAAVRVVPEPPSSASATPPTERIRTPARSANETPLRRLLRRNR